MQGLPKIARLTQRVVANFGNCLDSLPRGSLKGELKRPYVDQNLSFMGPELGKGFKDTGRKLDTAELFLCTQVEGL
jgi:hypothetical protein